MNIGITRRPRAHHEPALRRVPTVMQLSQTECGLASSIALLSYYGRDEELAELRKEFEAGRDGLSAKRIGDLLRSRNMDVAIYRVRAARGLKAFLNPVILYWENYHFVVLESVGKRHAVIVDPAAGRRKVTLDELEKSFSGVAIDATPGADFERKRMPVLHEWRNIPLLTRAAARQLGFTAILAICGYAATLGLPFITQWAVNSFTSSPDSSRLSTLLALVAAAAVGFYALQVIRTHVLAHAVTLIGSHLMFGTFSRLLSLPYKYFSTRSPGELLFRLNSVNSIRDLLSARFVQGALDIGTALCVLGYMFWVSWEIGLVALGIYSLTIVVLMATRRQVNEALDSEISQMSKSQAIQLDATVTIETIKMGGYSAQFLNRWNDEYARSLTAMKRRMRLQQGWISGLVSTIQLAGPLAMLLIGLHMVSTGTISLGAAVAIQAVSGMLFAVASSIFAAYNEFVEASRYMSRIHDITSAEPESAGGDLDSLAAASVHVDSVQFRFDKHSANVLDGVDLDIPAGAKVSLVGASGSGKSTLGRIICGLYQPTGGTIRFGGRDSRDYATDALRSEIGYVSQEVHLHNRTVVDNLKAGATMDDDEVIAFARSLGIIDFVDALPMGYNTVISEMGANFSGGQRQRLALARTLLKRPAILVLDEATAALDSLNERRVTEILENLGCTQIIIAHRLSTVRTSDVIYVLDGGRVVECGDHDELIGSGGHYSELYGRLEPVTA
ncbi:cytolysin B transporter [Williamsia sp. 1138]|uniref:Peptidase domain-containing ABC transporter n=1 Tax=Gordonia rubripertincta TaxID=36822 RepID=A0ABT4MRY4_GORRU|nr:MULTISPECIES: peptidase domain-containing ABC transporter [Mycobacteriales]MCZ4549753.1 peptidase domain-containing ABC transporter [Gordonia rubripertincta]OZG25999.1 cytolysin B transporter [Williamsia sp. 1138]